MQIEVDPLKASSVVVWRTLSGRDPIDAHLVHVQSAVYVLYDSPNEELSSWVKKD